MHQLKLKGYHVAVLLLIIRSEYQIAVGIISSLADEGPLRRQSIRDSWLQQGDRRHCYHASFMLIVLSVWWLDF